VKEVYASATAPQVSGLKSHPWFRTNNCFVAAKSRKRRNETNNCFLLAVIRAMCTIGVKIYVKSLREQLDSVSIGTGVIIDE
jgi:hypothetical protein